MDSFIRPLARLVSRQAMGLGWWRIWTGIRIKLRRGFSHTSSKYESSEGSFVPLRGAGEEPDVTPGGSRERLGGLDSLAVRCLRLAA